MGAHGGAGRCVVSTVHVMVGHAVRMGGPYRDGTAKDLQLRVADAIRYASTLWTVQTEQWVGDRGDGRRGRVDIVVRLVTGQPIAAIEIDRRSPRAKSIRKVTGHPAACKIILLRDPSPDQVIPLVVIDPESGKELHIYRLEVAP